MCDTGASNHMMWCDKRAVNVHDTQLLSLGHTREAIESMAMLDIPGQFISKSAELGMKAVVKECSYNKTHNFNLLSLSRLLHNQGWKIMHGDELLIHI